MTSYYDATHLRRRIAGAPRFFILPGLIAFLVGVATLWQLDQLISVSSWVDHADRVIAQAHLVWRDLRELESGYRNFLLTGEERFLEPYQKARSGVERDVEEVRRLSAGDSEISRRLDQVERKLREWTAYSDETLGRYRSGQSGVAILRAERERRRVDGIRVELAGIVDAEQVIRDERSAQARGVARGFFVFAVASALGLGFWVYGALRQRARWESLLAQWRDVFEHAEWGVFLGSADGRIALLNPAFARMHGYGVAELAGKPAEEVFIPECREDLRRRIEVANESGHHVFESRHLRKDGSEFPVLIDLTVVKDRGGRFAYQVVNVRDITEQKRLESRQALLADLSRILSESLELETNLKRFAERAVPEMGDWCFIDVIEPSGELRRLCVVHSDPSRRELAEEYLRRIPPFKGLRALPVERAREGFSIINRDVDEEALRRRGLEPERIRRVLELGTRSYMMVPLLARDRLLGVMAFFAAKRNFTDQEREFAEVVARRVALSADNARLFQEAQRAIRAREDVVAVVSHDLRNPLTAIRLSAGMLAKIQREGGIPEVGSGEFRKWIDRIDHSAERAWGLITDLLDLAKIESGTFSLSRGEVEPRVLIESVLPVFEPLAAEKETRLEARVAAGLGPVECDRERVIQALANLVDNALKFTPEGGTIELGAEPEGAMARFFVQDTGPGIPEQQQSRIFDRYWQPESRRTQGAGLGLSIAQGIVQAHGGRIWVESRNGAGARFCFTLPATRPLSAVV